MLCEHYIARYWRQIASSLLNLVLLPESYVQTAHVCSAKTASLARTQCIDNRLPMLKMLKTSVVLFMCAVACLGQAGVVTAGGGGYLPAPALIVPTGELEVDSTEYWRCMACVHC